MEKKLKLYSKEKELVDCTLLFEDNALPYVQLNAEVFNTGRIDGQKLNQCMQELHKLLDQSGLKLLCNCFRYDVRPSGMSLDMGGGKKAYKLVMGQQATELVDITEGTDDIDSIVSVEQQLEYYNKWIGSLGWKDYQTK